MLAIPCLMICLQSVIARFACTLTCLCAVHAFYPMPPDMLAIRACALCMHPDMPVRSSCSLSHASWHACKLWIRALHAPWHAFAHCMLAMACLLTWLQTVHARFACALFMLAIPCLLTCWQSVHARFACTLTCLSEQRYIKKTLTALLLMGIDWALQYKMNNVWLALTQKGLLRKMHYYSTVLCRGKVFSEKKAVIPNLLLAELWHWTRCCLLAFDRSIDLKTLRCLTDTLKILNSVLAIGMKELVLNSDSP